MCIGVYTTFCHPSSLPRNLPSPSGGNCAYKLHPCRNLPHFRNGPMSFALSNPRVAGWSGVIYGREPVRMAGGDARAQPGMRAGAPDGSLNGKKPPVPMRGLSEAASVIPGPLLATQPPGSLPPSPKRGFGRQSSGRPSQGPRPCMFPRVFALNVLIRATGPLTFLALFVKGPFPKPGTLSNNGFF